MAMAVRSSCLVGRKPPPADCFPFRARRPGKLALPLDKPGKPVAASVGSSIVRLDVQKLLVIGKENFTSDHFGAVLKQLSAHEGKLDFKFPSNVLLTFNGLMFAMPLQALAETCEAEDSFFNMPILLLVALIGATVGGLLARQRRGELQKVNEQLRQINAALRRQAKIESYAPNLSYAPVGSRSMENEVIVDPRREEMIARLKAGKSFLRNLDPEKAFGEFKAGLELAQSLNDPIEEKKAVRGLGASLQRQGKYREAIKYFNMVLKISDREGENSGNTEAYGAIADCYTELGELERAGKFYDKYISRLESD